MILSFAVLIQYWCVRDRHIERQTRDDSTYHASIESHGKNYQFDITANRKRFTLHASFVVVVLQ